MVTEIGKHISEVTDGMSTKKNKSKIPEKITLRDELSKQKGKLKKALKNGYTRKEIIDGLKARGVQVTMRDLALVVGKSFRRRKKSDSDTAHE